MAFAKLSRAVRRNELLLLASLLAGLVMALIEMALTWATGTGLWTYPGTVSASVFRSLQASGGAVAFDVAQIVVGFLLHLAVAMLLGIVFAKLAPGLRRGLGLDKLDETPSFGLLGAGFGLATFGVAWWGVLPYLNPLMVQGLDPTFLAVAHGAWGLSLGVTRKAWIQKAPEVRKSPHQASPQPTPSSPHKAPSGGQTGPSTEEPEEQPSPPEDVPTLDPEASSSDPDEQTEPREDRRWPTHGSNPGKSKAAGRSGGDDLSPWPNPPDETEGGEDEETGSENGYASPRTGRESSPASSNESSSEGDDEEDGLAMTEHARRSLRGLTDREPDLPPVHQALNTTLTHVAPGRAVCTIEADERLHDATGAVQSGVLISLGELAATIAMETVAPDSQHATVSSQIDVEGSVEEGHVVAEAEVTEQAGTTTLTEVEVRDATGAVLVRARFQAASEEESES